jgi:hypothetical protein
VHLLFLWGAAAVRCIAKGVMRLMVPRCPIYWVVHLLLLQIFGMFQIKILIALAKVCSIHGCEKILQTTTIAHNVPSSSGAAAARGE